MSKYGSKIIVCGSRQWTDRSLIKRALRRVFTGTTIVHGGARGADSIAGECARRLGFDVICVPAQWGRFGRSAGVKRNQQMLEMGPRKVLAFSSTNPMTPGTADMVRRAREAGVAVTLFFADGNVLRWRSGKGVM